MLRRPYDLGLPPMRLRGVPAVDWPAVPSSARCCCDAVTQVPGESSHRTRSIAAMTAGSSGSSPSAPRPARRGRRGVRTRPGEPQRHHWCGRLWAAPVAPAHRRCGRRRQPRCRPQRPRRHDWRHSYPRHGRHRRQRRRRRRRHRGRRRHGINYRRDRPAATTAVVLKPVGGSVVCRRRGLGRGPGRAAGVRHRGLRGPTVLMVDDIDQLARLGTAEPSGGSQLSRAALADLGTGVGGEYRGTPRRASRSG